MYCCLVSRGQSGGAVGMAPSTPWHMTPVLSTPNTPVGRMPSPLVPRNRMGASTPPGRAWGFRSSVRASPGGQMHCWLTLPEWYDMALPTNDRCIGRQMATVHGTPKR